MTMLFHAQPFLGRYQELRNLAKQLECWEKIQSEAHAFLEQTHNIQLLIQIALDESEIDTALKLLKSITIKDRYGYTYTASARYDPHEIHLMVARAAEETQPREAIQIYQHHAERLIALRERKNYQAACGFLIKIRSLYEQLAEHELWTPYITTIREQNRSLRALKEELVKAGL